MAYIKRNNARTLAREQHDHWMIQLENVHQEVEEVANAIFNQGK